MAMTVGALREIVDGIDDDALVYIDGAEVLEIQHDDEGLYLISEDNMCSDDAILDSHGSL
jgi:hypothetical protein